MIRTLARQTRAISIATKTFNSQPLEERVQNANETLQTKFSDIEPVIGLEVHAQLNLKSKLFSQGASSSQASPNTQLDLFDISLPGTLPRLNEAAIKAAILTGLALNCNIQNVIHFDRKNYFYTDMPAGFQITQYNQPIAKNGFIDFIVTSYHKSVIAHSQQYDVVKYLYSEDRQLNDDIVSPYIKRSQIRQLQLEQDSAKTLHQTKVGPKQQQLNSLVDYNRSGTGLIEIVFEPDLNNHHEASALVRELIMILKSLGTCDCELQAASLRVDANVSIKSILGQPMDEQIACRVELKNLNSLKSLNRGIAYEIQRQALALKAGEKVVQESRTFDTKLGRTIPLREKEKAVDYRYVPEPSLPPLRLNDNLIDKVRMGLPDKLPCNIRDTLVREYNLDLALVVEIVEEPGLADYMMEIMNDKSYDANVIADFLIYSIANLKNIHGVPIEVDLTSKDSDFLQKLSPRKMQQLFDMMLQDEISFAIAYEAMKYMLTSHPNIEPRKIVSGFGWQQINDESKIMEFCQELIGGMKNVSKKYSKTGDKKYLRLMLVKLSELHNSRVSIKKAIDCLNKLLRSE